MFDQVLDLIGDLWDFMAVLIATITLIVCTIAIISSPFIIGAMLYLAFFG